MNKKDVFELKSRFKKTECTFTKMTGCYVNADKEILVNFNKTFLNLDEDEFYKYLEIAKKALSGTIGNNLIELDFTPEEEKEGGKQRFLLGLKESKLKNEGLLDSFYHLIIDNYEYVGNYLILAFHDSYDVMMRTADNQKLDESEEVYNYLLFAICPVTLTKPGLGYLENENKIGARYRDWAVGAPDTGFIFPAFTDRSSDIHSVMFYTKNTAEPHHEFVELVLGCQVKSTAAEEKNLFQTILKEAIQDTKKSDEVFGDIQESLVQLAEEHAVFSEGLKEPMTLTNEAVREILQESGLSDEIKDKINTAYSENFTETPPAIDHLIDKKVLVENQKRKSEKALVEQVEKLQAQLEETKNLNASPLEEEETNAEKAVMNCEVVLNVKPEKIAQIKSEMINGKKCIIIPMDENEHMNVNGITDLL